jgi:hypothetical protein
MAMKRKKKGAPVRKRKSVKRSKGMLSELFNPIMAQAAGKAVLSGAIGGATAGMMIKLLPDTMDLKMKSFYCIGGGFIAATLLKMPNLGAGAAGVGMYNLLTSGGFLAENSDFSYADEIESLPMVLNESDFLQENAFLQENGYLQENSGGSNYGVGYFPEFGM